jgi:ubiquinone biosynthesis protein UbiJ
MALIDYILLTGQVAMAITAVGALLIASHRYIVVKPIQRSIAEYTSLIQPGSNGGKSLPDIAMGVARVEVKIEGLAKRVDTLEKSIKSSS